MEVAQQSPSSAIHGDRTVVEKILASLPSMIAGVWSDERELQLKATTQFRKLLIERNRPIEVVILVPKFVEFLTREDCPQLQYEAAWVLTNIASGTSDNVRVVIESGAVPLFVRLLGSPSDDVREQAVWALGNVAGDSLENRNLVLAQGALIPLLRLLNENAKLSMLRIATWTLSNFCRGTPGPPFKQIRPVLPALERLIHSTDEEVLTEACRALSYFSEGCTKLKIKAVIEANFCPRLVELLRHPSPSVLIPTLRTVGSICTGDMQTQIINHQSLPCLLNLLTNNHEEEIKKEACWTISNITAGNKDQIQAVIAAEIIGPLVHLLQTADFYIQKEAAWAISNATDGGTHEQIKYLVRQGCIRPLCDLLVCPDPTIVPVCLEGLENILKVGEAEKNIGITGGVNVYAQLIDEAEGLEKIKNLQSHDNTEINEKAVNILETYWMEDDEPSPPGDAAAAAGPSEERKLVSQLKRSTPENTDVYEQLIDEAERFEKIKNLQSHDNIEIYEKAEKILETPLPPGDAAAAGSSEERELVSQLKRRTPEKPSENTNGMETQAEGERAQLVQPETGVTVGPSGFPFPLLKKLKTGVTWFFPSSYLISKSKN